MMRILVLFLLAGFASAASVSRVIGGTEAVIEEYPSLVQVEFKLGVVWGQTCAGSILTSVHILSAASCFSGIFFAPNNRRIRAGTTYRNTGGIIRNVAIVINNPSYNSSTYDSDISVVRLETALEYSNSIQQGSIIAQSVILPQGLPVVSAGWGISSVEGYASNALLEANLLSIDSDVCCEQYSPNGITNSMICAFSVSGDQRACSGDEGGPPYYSGIIFGVASMSRNCTMSNLPSVYPKVAQFSDWIVQTAV